MGSNWDRSPEIVPGVVERLAELRRLYVAEQLADVRGQTEPEPVRPRESFDQAVARRLSELRALSELARYLHQGEVPAPPPTQADR